VIFICSLQNDTSDIPYKETEINDQSPDNIEFTTSTSRLETDVPEEFSRRGRGDRGGGTAIGEW
jgi:hypothetical protein